MRAFFLYRAGVSFHLAFGPDCVAAAKALVAKLGCDYEDFSVCGSHEVDPQSPIDLGKLWPHFTNNPSEWMISRQPANS